MDPYGGNIIVLDDAFAVKGGGSSYAWNVHFQGGFTDPSTGLIRFGAREYDADQGRWKQQDPAGWPDGANRYEMVRGNPLTGVDPSGMFRENAENGVAENLVAWNHIDYGEVKPLGLGGVGQHEEPVSFNVLSGTNQPPGQVSPAPTSNKNFPSLRLPTPEEKKHIQDQLDIARRAGIITFEEHFFLSMQLFHGKILIGSGTKDYGEDTGYYIIINRSLVKSSGALVGTLVHEATHALSLPFENNVYNLLERRGWPSAPQKRGDEVAAAMNRLPTKRSTLPPRELLVPTVPQTQPITKTPIPTSPRGSGGFGPENGGRSIFD
jgi:RHS repeat-associated protein